MYYLKVYFPTKRDYIMSSLNYIIPAFIMTFVLLVVFVITIYLIFRQKKLTDMKNDFINNMTHEFKTPHIHHIACRADAQRQLCTQVVEYA